MDSDRDKDSIPAVSSEDESLSPGFDSKRRLSNISTTIDVRPFPYPLSPLFQSLRFRLSVLVCAISLMLIHLSRKSHGVSFLEVCQALMWDSSMVRPPVVLLFLFWGWGIAVWILTVVGVNVGKTTNSCDIMSPMAYLDIFKAAALFTAIFLGLLAIIAPSIHIRGASSSDSHPVRDGVLALYEPLLLHLVVIAILLMPFNILYLPQRLYMARLLHESIFSPFYVINFSHILLTDILTSISKVLADMEVSLCAYSSLEEDPWSKHAIETCALSFVPLFVVALPFLCRFIQCCSLFHATSDRIQIISGFKYASAIVVILFDCMSRHEPDRYDLAQAWLISVVINTACCIYCDVFLDWGLFPNVLNLFTFNRQRTDDIKNNYIIRDYLFFPVWVYYFLIVLDGILRTGWTFRLLHAHPTVDGDLGILNYQIAEVLRRMFWCILRIENEYIRRHINRPASPSASSLNNGEEIPMVSLRTPSERNMSATEELI